MEYDNDTLADLITQIDPDSAQWAYNQFCEFCGKFLYSDETRCKKCQTPVNQPLKRAIPFLSSASAIEKLIVWLQKTKQRELLERIADAIARWVRSERNANSYRLEIVIICANAILDRSGHK